MTWQGLMIQALNITLMLSVGLDLDPGEVRLALRHKALLGAVLALNFGLIPLLAVTATWAVVMPGAVAAGVLLAALAPGGGTGTLLTRLAGGNLELSVVLLGAFTLLAVPLTPTLIIATTGSSNSTELDLLPILRTLVLFQGLPLLVGVGLRRRSTALARNVNRLARPLSNALFFGLVLGLLITRAHLLTQISPSVMATIAILILVTLAVPSLFPGPARDRAALSLTTGVRNLSLALLLANEFFTDLTTITVLAYGLLMYLFGVPWAFGFRRVASSDVEEAREP